MDDEEQTISMNAVDDNNLHELQLKIVIYRKILLKINEESAENANKRHKLSQISQRKRPPIPIKLEEFCNICNKKQNLELKSSFSTCNSCNKTICTERPCAIWTSDRNIWTCKICRNCLEQPVLACDWLLKQLNQRFSKDEIKAKIKNYDWIKGVDGNQFDISVEQRNHVRDYVEELIASIVGGSLDNVPIGQLYENLECLPQTVHEPNIKDSYSNLKVLVELIIEEVFKLPDLFDYSGVKKRPLKLPEFDPKRYEELLATAILNKIVESYNYEKTIDAKSDIESVTATASGSTEFITSPYPDNLNDEQDSSPSPLSSSSSNEPESFGSNYRNSSLSDQPPMSLSITNKNDELRTQYLNGGSVENLQSPTSTDQEEAYLSDYVQNHKVPLPRLNTVSSDSDLDEYQPEQIDCDGGKWQENWLFKKKKLKNETIPQIAMLVPSPTEDVKTLIGDTPTDEVSDLSDVESDSEYQNDLVDIPHVLVESKTVIGGKNEVKSFDEILQPGSLTSLNSISDPVIMEAKNDSIFVRYENGQEPQFIQLKTDAVPENGFNYSTTESIVSELSEFTVKDTIAEESDTIIELPPIPTPRRSSKIEELFENNTELTSIMHKTTNNQTYQTDNPFIDHQTNKDDTFITSIVINNNSNFPNEPYICKVEPTEFDISLKSADQLNFGSSEIIGNILPDENTFDSKTIPEAVYISSKPALAVAAVDLTQEAEDKRSKLLSAVPNLIISDLSDNQHNLVELSSESKKVLKPQDSLEIPQMENLESFEDTNIQTIIKQNSLDDSNNSLKSVGNSKVISEDSSRSGDATYLDHLITNKNIQLFDDNLLLIDNNEIQLMANVNTTSSDSSTLLPLILEMKKKSNAEELIDDSSYNNPFDQTYINRTNISIDSNNTLSSLYDSHDLPGSIAEREHMKWKNAQDIPNNPYSPEALQKRLREPNFKKPVDVSSLSAKYESLDRNAAGKPLQAVLAEGKTNNIRYSRDYYINDAKNASGSRKTNLLDSDQPSSEPSATSEDDNLIKSSTTVPTFKSELEIFKATPVHLVDDDSITISSANSDDLTALQTASTLSSLSTVQQPDSITLSEDSDSTRIYDLEKGQTRILNPSLQPPSPTIEKIKANLFANEEKPKPEKPTNKLLIPVFNSKPLSPNTVKFLAPKQKPVFRKASMEDLNSSSVTPATPPTTPISATLEQRDITYNGITEKLVIEEDVLPNLPSVRELAKSFLNSNASQSEQAPINRPKALILQSTSSSVVSAESNNDAAGDVPQKLSESYFPPYYKNTYHPIAAGHSITARSLSSKFREELKNSTSDNEQQVTLRHETNDADVTNGGQQAHQSGRLSPDRPSSPVLVKGLLRKSIAFFENLEQK